MVSSKLLCQAVLLLSVYIMPLESFGDYLYVGVFSQQTRRMLMLCYCLLKLGLKSVGERMDKTVKNSIVLITHIDICTRLFRL